MQKATIVRKIPVATAASEGIVLRFLSHRNNGKLEEALDCFTEEFRFKDHGIGLEFGDKKRLAEFLSKVREFYPDASLHPDAIFANGDDVVAEWILQATLVEPFWGGGLKRNVHVSLHGASIARINNGKITEWADYYDGLASRRTALASYFTEWIEL